ncbi:MAG: ParB/RepB/Spo0J family partition protein [Firmicutes bacterium]|nr:ParB/RepB/Spo0J family partition protein [Bacillota bacterium]
MAKSKISGLGRGLDAIFEDNSASTNESVTMLRLSEIEPNPDQPRRSFDSEALSQLADSIAANGLIQPLIVRPGKSEGYYEIIAGERRWRASKMAGLNEVPVIIMDLDDIKAAQISLIENIQRENLNAIEEANAFKKLITEYAMTQEELSRQIGKSRSLIANTLRLLDLPESVASMVEKGELSAGHARTLLGLQNRELIEGAAITAKKKELSVRALENLVKSMNRLEEQAEEAKEEEKNTVNVDYTAELARKMTSRLGRRITIRSKGKTHRVEIEYENDSDLDDIIKLLCGDNIFDE